MSSVSVVADVSLTDAAVGITEVGVPSVSGDSSLPPSSVTTGSSVPSWTSTGSPVSVTTIMLSPSGAPVAGTGRYSPIVGVCGVDSAEWSNSFRSNDVSSRSLGSTPSEVVGVRVVWCV